jgi:recombinational DNA repair ATPase RecF
MDLTVSQAEFNRLDAEFDCIAARANTYLREGSTVTIEEFKLLHQQLAKIGSRLIELRSRGVICIKSITRENARTTDGEIAKMFGGWSLDGESAGVSRVRDAHVERDQGLTSTLASSFVGFHIK